MRHFGIGSEPLQASRVFIGASITCADLAAAAGPGGLSREQMLLVPARPLFYFIAPLCAVELAACRLLLRLGAERFAASVILAVFRKPA